MGLLSFAMTIAVGMCFCIGGNDSANSWGSSVGSGAVPLKVAVLLGGFAEWLGATLLGYGVSGTIRKGVAKMDDPRCWACGYCDSAMPVYQLGMLAALIGATFFLLIATFAKLPVSTTHAIVGGVVGMTMVGAPGGSACLNWAWPKGLSAIVASWVISPLLSGAIGVCVYQITSALTTKTKAPVANALRLLPWMYCCATTVMVYLILVKSKPTKHLPVANQVLPSFVVGLVALVVVYTVVVPRVKRDVEALTCLPDGDDGSAVRTSRSLRYIAKGVGSTTTQVQPTPMAALDSAQENASDTPASDTPASAAATDDDTNGVELHEANGQQEVRKAAALAIGGRGAPPPGSADELERLRAVHVFRYLLVFVAFLESFGHGANDTANSTAAFGAVYDAYALGHFACSSSGTPWWIMSLAGLCVFFGVTTMGYRVIQTIGKDLTAIDYQLGFAIEFSSTATVVIATVLGLPVSSTHCQVGSVVFTGFVAHNGGSGASGGKGAGGVQWRLFGKIAISWVLTLPFAGGLAALLTVAFRAGLASHLAYDPVPTK